MCRKYYIENALYAYNNIVYDPKTDTLDTDPFFDNGLLKLGEEQTGISREDMWSICSYLKCTYIPNRIFEHQEKVVNLYGYEVEGISDLKVKV